MNDLRERLIQAGFAIELEPAVYNLIYTTDNYFEDGLWPDPPLPGDESAGEGFVQLPSKLWISAATHSYYTDLMDRAQLSGYSNGFFHGVSLRTDEELGAEDLEFLTANGLIRTRIELLDSGLLLGALALADARFADSPDEESRRLVESYRKGEFDLGEFGIDAEEVSYAIILPDRILDAYDAPGEILQLGARG